MFISRLREIREGGGDLSFHERLQIVRRQSFKANWLDPVTDPVPLYAAPRYGNFGGRPTLGIPAGLSVRLTGATFVRVEAQVAWPDFSPYERRLHVALAVAQQI